MRSKLYDFQAKALDLLRKRRIVVAPYRGMEKTAKAEKFCREHPDCLVISSGPKKMTGREFVVQWLFQRISPRRSPRTKSLERASNIRRRSK